MGRLAHPAAGIRTIFGATNREVSNPQWMSDGFNIGQIAITWNRFWILDLRARHFLRAARSS